MAARRYVEVAGQQYNKKQFSAKWTGIVSNYEIGITLSDEDSQFLSQVLSRISRFSIIMTRGKVSFKVVYQTFNDKRVKGIVMVTPNSNHHVWVGKQSVIKSLFPSGTLPDPSRENRRNTLRALRGVIDPQIEQYRKGLAGKPVIKSSITGKPIFGPYHVDHVYPFIRLVEEWCRENGYDLETIPIKCKGSVCHLSSVEMAESWFDYHALHASYQVLNASENISKGSRYFGEKTIKDS